MKLSPKKWLVLVVFVPAAVLVALLWLVIGGLRPFPPSHLIMVTGTPGSDYDEVGKKYRAILAESDIDLKLLPTAGAIDNLALMQDRRKGVDAGFLQGGTTTEGDSPGLVSLGTVFYKPLWFFISENFKGRTLDSLRGRKISIGKVGSGGRALTLKLMGKIGLDQNFAEFLAYPQEEAAAKLLSGEIDGATMMDSWDSPVVKRLLASRFVRLASFPHADAYVDVFPYLNKLFVPAGVGDLLLSRPPEDAIVLAPKGSLVVQRDLHPAIQYLLLQAAARVHSGPGVFRKPGQFPAEEAIDLPLSDQAAFFYRSGRPFLQRHLPFWLAVFVERLLVLLIPLVGMLYPAFTVLPALNNWWFRRKVFMLYGELRFLEEEIDRGSSRFSPEEMGSRIERLEAASNSLRVPLSHAGQLYTLKEHITLVRHKLAKLPAHLRSAGPA